MQQPSRNMNPVSAAGRVALRDAGNLQFADVFDICGLRLFARLLRAYDMANAR